jgi:hypothetical protein
MAKNKKKQKREKAARKGGEDGRREDPAPKLRTPRLLADDGAERREHRAELRAGTGRGTLAEEALAAIESAIGELERVYAEVAALGKSLALAREQLSEQEDELEDLREGAESDDPTSERVEATP